MNPANRWVMLATLLGVLILSAVHLPIAAPEWLRWLNPDWALALFLFWSMAAPRRVGIASAWITGLLLDVLQSDPLGLHGLVLATATYLSTRFQQRVSMFRLAQRSAIVFAVAALAQLVKVLVRSAEASVDIVPLTLVPALATAVVYTLFAALIERPASRFIP